MWSFLAFSKMSRRTLNLAISDTKYLAKAEYNQNEALEAISDKNGLD